MRCLLRLLVAAAVLWSGLVDSVAAKSKEESAIIEDVNAKILERLIQEEDYVAVFWCK
jgi:hypothetical protein